MSDNLKLTKAILETVQDADVIGCGCCSGGPSWAERAELRPRAEELGTDADTLYLVDKLTVLFKELS